MVDHEQFGVAELIKTLENLAAQWRSEVNNPQLQHEIEINYRKIVLLLLDEDSWDGRIPFDALLPEELMPQELSDKFDMIDPWNPA